MLVTLNIPKTLNSLSNEVYSELIDVMKIADKDTNIKCIIITGSLRAFSPGADAKDMEDMNFSKAYLSSMHFVRQNVVQSRKPMIAAVNGYCLAGGCELAMMCDIIVAGQNAKFGQPEINLAIIPGNGGT